MARRARSGSTGGSEVLLTYDGRQWTVYDDVVRSDMNTLRYDLGELSIDLVTVVRPGLYVVAADKVELLKEADFHIARKRVAFGSIFQNTSDIMSFARDAVVFGGFVVMLLVFFTVEGLSGQLGHIATVVQSLAK